MWEIFAYGVIPYTGVRNAEIIGRLKDGARLSRPSNCPEGIYAIMETTWKTSPGERPTFTALADSLEPFLEDATFENVIRDIGHEITSGQYKKRKGSMVRKGSVLTSQVIKDAKAQAGGDPGGYAYSGVPAVTPGSPPVPGGGEYAYAGVPVSFPEPPQVPVRSGEEQDGAAPAKPPAVVTEDAYDNTDYGDGDGAAPALVPAPASEEFGGFDDAAAAASSSSGGAATQAIALFAYTAADGEEVSFEKGDEFVDVGKAEEDGWLKGTVVRTGAAGTFPANYINQSDGAAAAPPAENFGGFGDDDGAAAQDALINTAASTTNADDEAFGGFDDSAASAAGMITIKAADVSIDYSEYGKLKLIGMLRKRGVDYTQANGDLDALRKLAADSDSGGADSVPQSRSNSITSGGSSIDGGGGGGSGGGGMALLRGKSEKDGTLKKEKKEKKKKTKKKKKSTASSIDRASVGMRCKVKGYECGGTIRFVGPHHEKEDEVRVLIELDNAVGKNDGTVKGHKYGECLPQHGVLVAPKRVEVVKARGSFKIGGHGKTGLSSQRTSLGLSGAMASLGGLGGDITSGINL